MTDRELLEKAVKAAGIDFVPHPFMHNRGDGMLCKSGAIWNPLNNDGDALRLAVKLGLQIVHYSVTSKGPDRVGAGNPGKIEVYHTDPYAATRRAIVRAAAALEANT